VVTCGTDRLADVAKMASLMLLNPLRPIIFTGSQRTLDDANNDVERNLRDALFMADKLDPGFTWYSEEES
jgi:L-asparaginase/Glu-tRNA(Gln) amidotransferase subunit D